VNHYINGSSSMSDELLLYAKFYFKKEVLLQQNQFLTITSRLHNVYGYPIKRNLSFDKLFVPYTIRRVKAGIDLKIRSDPLTNISASDINDFLRVCQDFSRDVLKK